jgi:hypothetical protein
MSETTKPNGFFDDGVTPCITLAGQRWPIPLFGVRQLRSVGPAVSRVTTAMRDLAERRLAALTPDQRVSILAQVPKDVATMGEDRALRNRLWAITDFPVEMSKEMPEQLFEDLTTAVFWALKRAHPQLTLDEFEEMPTGMIELINCIGIIADQTGMMRKVDPSADPLAQAGSNLSPSSRTGTT